MKYTITIESTGAADVGFLDPKVVCDYDDFDDVRETGSKESFLKKAKGLLRFNNVAMLLAGVTSWSSVEITEEGGSALNPPTKLTFVAEQFQDETITPDMIKNAVAYGLFHDYTSNFDYWNPETKVNAQGVTLMPLGFLTILMKAEKLFETEEEAKAVVNVVQDE